MDSILTVHVASSTDDTRIESLVPLIVIVFACLNPHPPAKIAPQCPLARTVRGIHVAILRLQSAQPVPARTRVGPTRGRRIPLLVLAVVTRLGDVDSNVRRDHGQERQGE